MLYDPKVNCLFINDFVCQKFEFMQYIDYLIDCGYSEW